MEYYLAERPDAVVVMHCDNGSMISAPHYYEPQGYQFALARLGGAVRRRLQREGHVRTRRSTMGNLPKNGRPFLDQGNAIYHVCGAMPIVGEFPAGCDINPFSPDELLDIGLLTIEETLSFALLEGFRPYECFNEDGHKEGLGWPRQ
jgi:hypothetical protein